MRPARSSEEGFKICADAEFFRRQEGVACVWRERWSGSAAAQRISPSATRPSRDHFKSRLPSALRPTLARGVPLSVEFQRRRGLNFPGLLPPPLFVESVHVVSSSQSDARNTPSKETIKQIDGVCQSLFCIV